MGNHCAMKKKFPTAPVRANVRGTCALHATRISAVAPGAIGAASGTSITVSSSALSSSGAMKRRDAVRSTPPTAIEPTSMRAHSFGSRVGSSPKPASALSRMKVERVFFQAFQ